MSQASYPKKPPKPFFVWFRMIRLVLGLLIIGIGIWMFLIRFIHNPESGGSGLIPLVIIFSGVFLAASAGISKRKAAELSDPTEN